MKKSDKKLFIGMVVAILIGFNATIFFLVKNHYVAFDGLDIISIGAYVIGGMFLFSLVVRKIAWFKPYFISKYNILSSKVRYQQEFDFPKKILFEKLIEVMHDTGFKIIQTNENTGDIFAASSISWLSWGENIYINLREVNDKTIVDFCSVCFWGIYSSGKNERNYEEFLQEFEKSLTI